MKTTKKLLIAASWVVILSFVALTAATFAWMSIATSYKVSDIDLAVITDNALEISLDKDGQPLEWKKNLSGEELIGTDTVMRPVTWSWADRTFYAPSYGLDGRIDFLDKKLVTSTSQDSTPSADKAEDAEGVGYLIAADFWLRTGSSKIMVYLSGPISEEGVEISNGTYVVGAPMWDADSIKHIGGGNGAEYVLRIGFLTYDYYDSYGDLVDEAGFVIYEPNTTADESTLGTDGKPLEGDGKLIKQTPSKFTEVDPVMKDQVEYECGDFIGDSTDMFKLVANEPRKVTLFIWLEGQDERCDNTISAGKILANLQIAADTQNNQQGIGRPEGGGGE